MPTSPSTVRNECTKVSRRDGDEDEGERQDEAHAHLRSRRDPQILVLQATSVVAAQQCAGRKLILQQHFTHICEPGLDAREQHQHRESDPEHSHAHLVGEGADDWKQARDAQRFHQEQAHRDLDHDDHERRNVGRAEGADIARAADHFRHRTGDQREVDRRAADRNGSTSADTKNCTTDEEDSVETARSWPRTMSSYSFMCRSTTTARVRMLSTDLLTRLSVSWTQAPLRHHPRRIECRSPLACDRRPSLPCAPSPATCECRRGYRLRHCVPRSWRRPRRRAPSLALRAAHRRRPDDSLRYA